MNSIDLTKIKFKTYTDDDNKSYSNVLNTPISILEEALVNPDGQNGGISPGIVSPFINSLRGFRIYGTGPSMMPLSDNVIGFNFISRPQLNLTDENVIRAEGLNNLYGVNNNDMGAYIRGTLDEKWALGRNIPFLNNKLPWITSLNEYLKTSTGYADLELKIDTTSPGMREQVAQRVTSRLEENGQFSLNQTYYNPRPSVIQALFQTWEMYISEVVSGDRMVEPRLQYLVRNKYDFDCRNYTIILNRDTEYLEHIFMTVQSIPTTYPAGGMASLDRTRNSLRGEGQDEFSVRFSSIGMRFNEIPVITAFNQHQYNYNPELHPYVRRERYRELQSDEYEAYRYQAYPLLLYKSADRRSNEITEQTRTGIKLTWWVNKRNTGAGGIEEY